MYIATNNYQKSNLWFNIDFFKLTPRLARIKHLRLFSFWFSIMAVGAFAPQIIINNSLLSHLVEIKLILLGLINILFLKIRRLNDFNLKGWWVLLCSILILGAIWFSAIFFIPGTNGTNRFGDKSNTATIANYLLIFAAPLTYFILYLCGIYDLT